MKILPTQSEIKAALDYDAESGEFTWKARDFSCFKTKKAAATWNSRFSGKRAGGLCKGYLEIKINGVKYYAHRLAYKYVYGECPEYIDHINRDISDNRISNLRSCSKKENARNRKISSSNKSGFHGVYKVDDGKVNKWGALIKTDEGKVWLGSFPTKSEAAKARKDAEAKYGYHRNHGAILPAAESE